MVFAFIVNGFAMVLVIAGCLHLFRQQRRRAQKNRGELMVSRRSGLAMGAMLLGIQAILQPEARHMLVEEQKEDSIDDQEAGEPLGGREFHEQLRQVRSGEEVEELTVRMDAPDANAETVSQKGLYQGIPRATAPGAQRGRGGGVNRADGCT